MCDSGPLLDSDVLTIGAVFTGDGVFGVDVWRPFQNSSSPSSSSSTVASSVLSLSESNVWKLKAKVIITLAQWISKFYEFG